MPLYLINIWVFLFFYRRWQVLINFKSHFTYGTNSAITPILCAVKRILMDLDMKYFYCANIRPTAQEFHSL
jgi:hypothetical protein